ncbi:MAG: hypothetical protein KGD68_08760 [Candidatus Lokiarchaeota archaeon]|nr:hypothetical protein [Candidatus Lokiarchaeota archaeon]
MSADQIKLVLYMKDMFSDLIYINSVIATELIKITENLSALRHGEDFLKKSTCLQEHNDLNKDIINILNKYGKLSDEIDRKIRLEKHVLRHLEDSK